MEVGTIYNHVWNQSGNRKVERLCFRIGVLINLHTNALFYRQSETKSFFIVITE